MYTCYNRINQTTCPTFHGKAGDYPHKDNPIMHYINSLQITLTPEESIRVIPCASAQSVGFCLSGEQAKGQPDFSIWFTTAHIAQIEQLLNVLWAMRDEQATKTQQRLEELEQVWQAALPVPVPVPVSVTVAEF
jgi:hypothetical protein